MQTDLFLKRSKKDELLEWIKLRREVKTHEVVAWGLDHNHIRAERDCRDFAREGLIERIPEDEKLFRFGRLKEDVWRYKTEFSYEGVGR